MELHIVTWKSDKLQSGQKIFLVKEAFDDSDAVVKVKRQIDQSWLGVPGETFKAKRVVFNERDTFAV